MVARTPLGRAGTPEDVANTYVWLASDQASFIHGTVISVDGGVCNLGTQKTSPSEHNADALDSWVPTRQRDLQHKVTVRADRQAGAGAHWARSSELTPRAWSHGVPSQFQLVFLVSE